MAFAKPKMAKADSSNRTGFKEGPAPGQRDQRNEILGRMVTVRNMSMAQFSEDLQRIAGGYIRVPVEDKTGLDGSYDFTLTFTAAVVAVLVGLVLAALGAFRRSH